MNKKENGKKWYQSPSNIIIAIACIILVPILLANLWIMVQSQSNQDEIPNVFGYKPFIVLSGSMEGKILKGDLIITKMTDPEKLKLQDIIAFRDAAGTVTTHRIIDIVTTAEGKTYFITKGDNNDTQDQNLVAFSDVEGLYVARIPGIGSMMKSLSEPATIFILVLIITIVFGIGFMISNKKEKELERLEFLEFKKMKEEMALAAKTKKTKSIKAVEDEEPLEEEEDEEITKPQPKKKATSTTSKKKPQAKSTSAKTVVKPTTAKKATTKTASTKTKSATVTSKKAKSTTK